MAYLKFGVHGAGVGGEWVYHCDMSQDCVAIGYFDGVGLIVSTKGAGAQILQVAL